jgi:hypothetical protein
MSLDALHQELLYITSQNIHSIAVQPSPPKTTNRGFRHNQELSARDPFSFDKGGNQAKFLDLFQNIRPDEIPPDVIGAIDRILLLETNPAGINNFPLQQSQQFSSNIDSRNGDHGLITDNFVSRLLNTNSQKNVQNLHPFNIASNPKDMFRPEVDESLFMTVQQSVPVAASKPKVDFQEIHQLIESFQQLLLTTPPNVNRGLPVDTNIRFVKIQKQSAIDNFHSIADSLLNVFPTKTNPNIRRSKLGPQRNTNTRRTTDPIHSKNKRIPTTRKPQIPKSPTEHLFRRNQNQWHIPQHSTARAHQNQRTKTQHRKQPPGIVIPRGRQNSHIPNKQIQSKTTTTIKKLKQPPRPLITQHKPNTRIHGDRNQKPPPKVIPKDIPITLPNTNMVDIKVPPKTQTNGIEIQIPVTWEYFGSVKGKTGTSPSSRKVRVQMSSMKIPNNWRQFQVMHVIPHKERVTEFKKPEMTQNRNAKMTQTTKGFAKQTEMLTTRVLTQTTALPTINVKATPSNAKKSNTSKPKEELSATKLLRLIKKKLKQAKKTGNIPFSLLKMLLEKRQTLIRKLKEERKMKKRKRKEREQTKRKEKLKAAKEKTITTPGPKIPIKPKLIVDERTIKVDNHPIMLSNAPAKNIITIGKNFMRSFNTDNTSVSSTKDTNNRTKSSRYDIINQTSQHINSENTNKMSSFSPGDPTVSLLGLDSRPSQSKTRKSNPAGNMKHIDPKYSWPKHTVVKGSKTIHNNAKHRVVKGSENINDNAIHTVVKGPGTINKNAKHTVVKGSETINNNAQHTIAKGSETMNKNANNADKLSEAVIQLPTSHSNSQSIAITSLPNNTEVNNAVHALGLQKQQSMTGFDPPPPIHTTAASQSDFNSLTGDINKKDNLNVVTTPKYQEWIPDGHPPPPPSPPSTPPSP